jgi:hypothetical protein
VGGRSCRCRLAGNLGNAGANMGHPFRVGMSRRVVYQETFAGHRLPPAALGNGPSGERLATQGWRQGYNYNRSFATQGAWRIPAETICSFKAAILQTLSAILSGDGLDGGTRRVAVVVAILCGSQQMNNLRCALFLLISFVPILLRHGITLTMYYPCPIRSPW